MIVVGDVGQIVSLSGGKDSTAMLLLMLEYGEQIDDIVFFDWGKEFGQIYEHLAKLEHHIGRSITRVEPDHPWEYWMFEHVKVKGKRKGERGYGWPSPLCRWCTRIKQQVLKRAYPTETHCIGYAYEERFSRAYRASNRLAQRYPLLEWGVSETEALKLCYRHGFDFGGLYRIMRRVSCWCCPFASEREVAALRDNFPSLWAQLQLWARRARCSLPNGFAMAKYLYDGQKELVQRL